MSFSLGVIGLGRMAKVILQGLLDKGRFKPEEVLAVVGQSKSISRAIKHFSSDLLVLDSNDLNSQKVWDAPVKILAVKPQQLDRIKEQKTTKVLSTFESKPLLIRQRQYTLDTNPVRIKKSIKRRGKTQQNNTCVMFFDIFDFLLRI